jgi:hypothetical protein
MTRRLLALITWAGALLWTWGAAIAEPNVMAIGGIAFGLFGIAWGLVVAIQDDVDDAELPYVPINQGEFMFDHETDEWRRSVADMSEFEREVAEDSRRAALGLAGNREDER